MSEYSGADDIQLLRRAQEGDREAFGDLYMRHAQAVFRFLYAHLDNRLDAEDLTAEVFLRVWRSLPGYREQGIPFQALLFRIARNALIDLYRRSDHVEQALEMDDLPDLEGLTNPGDQVVTRSEYQRVREVLGRLKEDYRSVLVLRFFSGLSPEETALVMGRSTGAVRVLQHRALAALRLIIEET
jgi:RNA polymerase sigma-70 factor (ECF subfamily)